MLGAAAIVEGSDALVVAAIVGVFDAAADAGVVLWDNVVVTSTKDAGATFLFFLVLLGVVGRFDEECVGLAGVCVAVNSFSMAVGAVAW